MRERRPHPEERRYFLTVPEVMHIYRLGRNAVYDLANQYLATDGERGIPCQQYGKQFRFPIAAIEHDIGMPILRSSPNETADLDHPDRGPTTEHRTRSSADPKQVPLPFTP